MWLWRLLRQQVQHYWWGAPKRRHQREVRSHNCCVSELQLQTIYVRRIPLLHLHLLVGYMGPLCLLYIHVSYATIAGGRENLVSHNDGVIAGGRENTVTSMSVDLRVAHSFQTHDVNTC